MFHVARDSFPYVNGSLNMRLPCTPSLVHILFLYILICNNFLRAGKNFIGKWQGKTEPGIISMQRLWCTTELWPLWFYSILIAIAEVRIFCIPALQEPGSCNPSVSFRVGTGTLYFFSSPLSLLWLQVSLKKHSKRVLEAYTRNHWKCTGLSLSWLDTEPEKCQSRSLSHFWAFMSCRSVCMHDSPNTESNNAKYAW